MAVTKAIEGQRGRQPLPAPVLAPGSEPSGAGRLPTQVSTPHAPMTPFRPASLPASCSGRPALTPATLALCVLALLPCAARAADPGHQHPATAAAPAAAEWTEGEVRRVDKPQGRLTLRHGPLPQLGMPGMTMVFRVAEPSMLDRVGGGDRVRFQAQRVNGVVTVTRLERLP